VQPQVKRWWVLWHIFDGGKGGEAVVWFLEVVLFGFFGAGLGVFEVGLDLSCCRVAEVLEERS